MPRTSTRPDGPPPWHRRALAGRRDDARPAASRDAVAAATTACDRRDGDALADAIRALLPLAPDHLKIDLVAVLELATVDTELAIIRWSHLRRHLA